MTNPLPFQWDGEAMRPTRGFARPADQEYVVGEVYTLIEADRAARAQPSPLLRRRSTRPG
jgi:hypothetical protein